ncbi:hypothetical protein BOTBODRAFT_39523 [Botryobasidium botryosum FD-172 SS1]|uniref:Uncharacterized protein n=1 Tax=Botryobasidium botryosum (strain FD-172 SS1) TaxID=930990 RepID=A0A067LTD6_BOTB1|nr:hypothetical protein BOTBODRAFT_39523 [Botryobasidium botryosum FD-172 SS1]
MIQGAGKNGRRSDRLEQKTRWACLHAISSTEGAISALTSGSQQIPIPQVFCAAPWAVNEEKLKLAIELIKVRFCSMLKGKAIVRKSPRQQPPQATPKKWYKSRTMETSGQNRHILSPISTTPARDGKRAPGAWRSAFKDSMACNPHPTGKRRAAFEK